MGKKRTKSRHDYAPAAANLAYSGVSQEELEQQIRWLKAHGAKDIEVELDTGVYDVPGQFYIIKYVR